MNDQSLRPVCLSLGSNVGDRLACLRAAGQALAGYVDALKFSPVYETAPAYITDQPCFLNAAAVGRTALDPKTLLFTVKTIERDIGRKPTYRYGPRVIDIDILFYGDLQVASPELTVPHALLAERAFVLRPLADIAPMWRHPATGLTVAAMLSSLSDRNDPCLIKEALSV